MKLTKFGYPVLLVTFALTPLSLFAQSQQQCTPPCPQQQCTSPCASTSGGGGGFQAEINPYGGWYWSGTNASGPGRFLNNQLIGVRGGVYLTPSFELGGNYSFSNKFQPNNTNEGGNFAGALGFPQGSVRANIWEVELTYNFGKRSIFGSTALRPYITGGAGGLTTSVKNANSFVLNVVPSTDIFGRPIFVPNDVINDHDTFFTFSYGGGLKAERLWGPMGVFGDIRGRTLPNFFGSATTRTELTAGLTFSWGER